MPEGFSRIRPVWLVGGVAAVVMLGTCTLIFACGVLALVWYINQTSSNAARATQVTFQHQTEQSVAPTPMPIALTTINPTPLPIIPTAPLSPTLIPLSTPAQITALRPAPDQMVRTYYALVSQQRYDLTWPMLTDTFKQKFNCCAPNYNYGEYMSWWDSVNHVEFGSVRTVFQSEDRAVVYAELYYVMNTGDRSSVDRDPYIHLVYDSTTGNWRFDDKRATP